MIHYTIRRQSRKKGLDLRPCRSGVLETSVCDDNMESTVGNTLQWESLQHSPVLLLQEAVQRHAHLPHTGVMTHSIPVKDLEKEEEQQGKGDAMSIEYVL